MRIRQLSVIFVAHLFYLVGCQSDSTPAIDPEEPFENHVVISPEGGDEPEEQLQVVDPKEEEELPQQQSFEWQQDPKMECDLPMASEKFMELKADNRLQDYLPYPETGYIYDEVYHYLYLTLDSIGAKQVLKTDEVWGPIEWGQEFECGVTYFSEQYIEVGAGGKMYTKSKNKSVLLNAIEPVIRFIPCENCYDYNPVWKEDSTRYEPSEAEAGCYYTIENDSLGYLMLSWYCGC